MCVAHKKKSIQVWRNILGQLIHYNTITVLKTVTCKWVSLGTYWSSSPISEVMTGCLHAVIKIWLLSSRTSGLCSRHAKIRCLDTNKEEYSQLDKLTKINQEWIRQHKVLAPPYWHDTLHIRVGNYCISSTHFLKVQRERISSGALQNRREGEAVRSRGGVVGGNLCFQSQIHSPTQTVRGIWSGLYTAWGWDSSYCWTQFGPWRDEDVGAPGSPYSRSSMKAYVRCFMCISPNTKEK